MRRSSPARTASPEPLGDFHEEAVIPVCAGMTSKAMSALYDTQQVRARVLARGDRLRRGRDIAARGGRRLLEMLDYRDDPALQRESPNVVVDLGCGPGARRRRSRSAGRRRVLALDLALPMLRESRSASSAAKLFARHPQPVCADARARCRWRRTRSTCCSPTCVPAMGPKTWAVAFAGFRRVLKRGAWVAAFDLRPDTLWELREAFARARIHRRAQDRLRRRTSSVRSTSPGSAMRWCAPASTNRCSSARSRRRPIPDLAVLMRGIARDRRDQWLRAWLTGARVSPRPNAEPLRSRRRGTLATGNHHRDGLGAAGRIREGRKSRASRRTRFRYDGADQRIAMDFEIRRSFLGIDRRTSGIPHRDELLRGADFPGAVPDRSAGVEMNRRPFPRQAPPPDRGAGNQPTKIFTPTGLLSEATPAQHGRSPVR